MDLKKDLLDREELVVREGLPRNKARNWYSFDGYATTYEYAVHNASLSNVCRGLVERVFFVKNADGDLVRPPRPLPGVFAARMGNVGCNLSRIVRYCPSMTRHQFVNSYTGLRRRVYEKAADSLSVLGLTRADAQLSTFVKAEKINMTLKSDPAPRIIQPRSPRYNVEVGRFLKPMEKRLMKAIDTMWGEVTAIKGYTSEQVGQIMYEKSLKFADPVFVGLDASRFDQHCSKESLEWEHSIYNNISRSGYLAELLTWQLHNKGKAYVPDGYVRYSVEGCRMSGDMNTSMGNYLIMSSLLYQYRRESKTHFSLANCGDDCVLFMERRDLNKLVTLPSWFIEMGFTMKVEKPVYQIEKVEFCQQHPVLLSRGWTMVRRPDVCLTKDVCVVRGGMTDDMLQGWLCAQRDGGLSLYGDCPVLGAFYRQFPAGDHCGMESDLIAPHKLRASKQCGNIEPAHRYSFWLAFGLTPDEQLAIERDLVGWVPRVERSKGKLRLPTLLDYCSR